MTGRWSTWLAISLFVLAMIGYVCFFVLQAANGESAEAFLSWRISFDLAFASMAIVGLLVAIHRPSNPIGWIYLAASISQVVVSCADQYAKYLVNSPQSNIPQLTLLLWSSNWVWRVAIAVPIVFGILFFPTGRLPSRRWRPFAWFAAVVIGAGILAEMFRPGILYENGGPPDANNPFGIEGLKTAIDLVLSTSELLLAILAPAAAASLFFRYRHASSQERQQLKWFGFAASIYVLMIPVSILQSVLAATTTLQIDVLEFLFIAGLAALPTGAGIAILRHNLYDIDRLINRTLVYGSLTALLLLGFAANVLLFQLILEPFTRGNDLAVAGSTLLVFALFRPVRDRLQRFVDRRFYRQRYDAQRTLQSFGVTARDAVDLDQLSTELTGVISTTIQPAHVSIWLRAETAGRDRI